MPDSIRSPQSSRMTARIGLVVVALILAGCFGILISTSNAQSTQTATTAR